MRLGLAIRAFVRTLFDANFGGKIELILKHREDGDCEDGDAVSVAPVANGDVSQASPNRPSRPERSEAITLLAALQREARFIDFLQEPLDDYSDDQVGAAARDVHRQCHETLRRLLDILPITDRQEGTEIELPADFDPGQWRATGNVSSDSVIRGRVAHAGWRAAKCELPTWSGSEASALVLAPAEVEVP